MAANPLPVAYIKEGNSPVDQNRSYFTTGHTDFRFRASWNPQTKGKPPPMTWHNNIYISIKNDIKVCYIIRLKVYSALDHISSNDSFAYIKQDIRRFTSFRSQSLEIATCCIIELGNNRFVQATELKDKIRIDIRKWESQNIQN